MDFIHSLENTGEGLANKILSKLEDWLDITNIRDQNCDKGSNTSGKYNTKVIELNKYLELVQCAAHCFN